jgi:hypothetical protein
MEATRGHSAPPCMLHERSIVEALAGLLTLHLPMLGSQDYQMRNLVEIKQSQPYFWPARPTHL